MNYSELKSKILESDPDDWMRSKPEVIYTFPADIRIQIRRIAEEGESRPFSEPWATKHPDPSATVSMWGLFFNGSLIEEFWFASVDGGRAEIPYPDLETKSHITEWQYRIAQIVDSGRLDEYLRRSGISVK